MTDNYTHIVDLAKEVQPPDDGILTRTLFNDDDAKAVIFGFGHGEELSEHTASMPAILHFIQGAAELTLGENTVEASWNVDSHGAKPEAQRARKNAGGYVVAVVEEVNTKSTKSTPASVL